MINYQLINELVLMRLLVGEEVDEVVRADDWLNEVLCGLDKQGRFVVIEDTNEY